MNEFVVIVPARGGSTRIPRKNIRPLAGRPLIDYTLACASEAGLSGQIIVSTEDPEIRAIAVRHGGVRVFNRPAQLVTAAASTESVLVDVLAQLAASNERPRWIVTLPPTSPFRRADTLRYFIDQTTVDSEAQDCLMSVTENRGDFWQRTETGKWARLFPQAPHRQQDRTPVYEENSAIYVTRIDALTQTGSILGRRTRGIPIDPIEAFDINTPLDFELAECIARMCR